MQDTLLFSGQMQVNLEGDAPSLGVYQPIKTLSCSPVAGIIPKTKLLAINWKKHGDKTKKFKVCCKHMRKISIYLPESPCVSAEQSTLHPISAYIFMLLVKTSLNSHV